MLSCKQVQDQLPQYVADGEPMSPYYAALRTHLYSCSACQAYAHRLRSVEDALRTCPPVHPSPLLTNRILRTVGRERAEAEEWQPLSWDVWVPIATFIMALIIASASLSQEMLAPVRDTRMAEMLAAWSHFLQSRSSLWGSTKRDLLWAVARGILATIAGLGMGITLAYWSERGGASLQDLEQRLTNTAERLWERTRHV
ncbi:MAG: hypothetical protein U9R48_03875 [Chloroflexota bacterium]|nr:hypothetical protein [Chloroflexota bacterium]